MNPRLVFAFLAACRTPGDIDQHLITLAWYGSQCESIVEFGVRTGISTVAWLISAPYNLDCYDLEKHPEVDDLSEMAVEWTIFRFHQENTLECTIPECDLLFIDTLHTYDQLKQELARHADKAKKWIILHDTETFPDMTRAAVEWEAANPHWKLKQHFQHQHGLTVYERV